MGKEKNVKRITLTFDDGSQEDIDKGFLGEFKVDENRESTEVIFQMVNLSGGELKMFIGSVIQLGDKLGMFDE